MANPKWVTPAFAHIIEMRLTDLDWHCINCPATFKAVTIEAPKERFERCPGANR